MCSRRHNYRRYYRYRRLDYLFNCIDGLLVTYISALALAFRIATHRDDSPLASKLIQNIIGSRVYNVYILANRGSISRIFNPSTSEWALILEN